MTGLPALADRVRPCRHEPAQVPHDIKWYKIDIGGIFTGIWFATFLGRCVRHKSRQRDTKNDIQWYKWYRIDIKWYKIDFKWYKIGVKMMQDGYKIDIKLIQNWCKNDAGCRKSRCFSPSSTSARRPVIDYL